MILKGKPEYSQVGKGISYLEFASPELYEELPSPRLLNTLNRFDWLPAKTSTYKNKIVLTTRNPKDVAVSLYHHHITLQEMYNYSGDFEHWFPLYRDGKRTIFSSLA
ncbi:sulfotransferase 1c2-like [Plakobranchus ocellatus]|uniref:Sulfotransferase 1c2-like n=1 Tax=Plakobranchus ocellatus TaxID=259542 RepID=A0AAV4AR75_9GAST|nr:sulfotransferase 1c2-like [Plakobranchus ocellatus]